MLPGSALALLLAPVLAIGALVLVASAGWAQVDCDRYPAGGAARDSCYQREYRKSRDDLQRAYEEQQREDRHWRAQHQEQQRQQNRAWHDLDPQDREEEDR